MSTTPIQAQNSTVARTPVTRTTAAPLPTTTLPRSSEDNRRMEVIVTRSMFRLMDEAFRQHLISFEHRIANLVLIWSTFKVHIYVLNFFHLNVTRMWEKFMKKMHIKNVDKLTSANQKRWNEGHNWGIQPHIWRKLLWEGIRGCWEKWHLVKIFSMFYYTFSIIFYHNIDFIHIFFLNFVSTFQ